MIDVIVSNSNCPHCDTQKKIMTKSFFIDEYNIIVMGSEKFQSYDLKDKVDAVPFIIVRDEIGAIKYAEKGIMDGTSLRKIERVGTTIEVEKNYNRHEMRSAHLMSRYMDS